MSNNVGEWIRWGLAVAVIPGFLLVANLWQVVAIQQTQIAMVKDAFAAQAQSTGARLDKITEKYENQNDSLIEANAALESLKERVSEVLESLRARRKGG